MVSPAAVVEQISISEEEEAAARSQQLREDEVLARRLQVEDDSDMGTCWRYTHTYEYWNPSFTAALVSASLTVVGDKKKRNRSWSYSSLSIRNVKVPDAS